MGNRNVKLNNQRSAPHSVETLFVQSTAKPGPSTVRKKKESALEQFQIFAALDVGTYASGYAYQRRSALQNNPHLVNIMNKTLNKLTGHKEPTCLLLKPDKSFDSFGTAAREKYFRFKTQNVTNKPEDWRDYLYFENFKMMLYHRQNDIIRDDLPAEAENEKPVPIIDVFTKTIEYLKNEMLAHLKTSSVLDPFGSDSSTVKWVITVPAIWEDQTKQLMLRAAIKAGISEECLVLSLEPECAAIHCSQLPPGSLDICGDYNKIERVVEPGATVMVVDIGGGTVDIAIMMIKEDGTIEQVHKSGGNGLGGVRINDKILQELSRVFGDDVMQEFYRTYGVDELELREEIERAKCMWQRNNGASVNDVFRIKFSHNLKMTWEKHNAEKELDQHLREHNITHEAGHLMLYKEKVDTLFNECVESILKFLKDVMSSSSCNGKTINALLAVGGFAESDYLITSLRAKLRDKGIPVIRPESPELSIMKGAVLYGYDEGIISSRIMIHTYGVAMTTKFDHNRHDECEKYTDNGEEMANNVFRKHVEVGEKISVQKWIHSKDYYPDPDNKTQRVYIFKSNKKTPKHTTEEDGSTCIGNVDVDFPTRDSTAEPKVKIEFYFAGTFIRVRAIDGDNRVRYVRISSP